MRVVDKSDELEEAVSETTEVDGLTELDRFVLVELLDCDEINTDSQTVSEALETILSEDVVADARVYAAPSLIDEQARSVGETLFGNPNSDLDSVVAVLARAKLNYVADDGIPSDRAYVDAESVDGVVRVNLTN